MRSNLIMVPHLTLKIHPRINTGSHVPITNKYINCFEFPFERNRLIKFFKELVYKNTNLQICYSFNIPPSKSKNRFLANEVPISFACLLSFAEAAAHKGVPIYLYPLGTWSGRSFEERGNPLIFNDFKNIFNLKLDLESTHEIKKKMEVVGVSYPTEIEAKKNDKNQVNLDGYISVKPISSETVVELLAAGLNMVIPNGDEYMLISMDPVSDWYPRDDFSLSWKTDSDNSASCGAIRFPIFVRSNTIFYSKRGSDFMTVFKKEIEELSQKNKSNISSNPFHNEVTEKPADDVQSDSEYHEVSNAQYEFPKTSTDNQTTETADVTSSKSVTATKSKEEAPILDTDELLSARQLSSFLNQFKDEMKEQIFGMVEETVKKYAAKENTQSVSGSKKETEVRSVINVNDCVKSEADDSDLPKLLNTLSQIEEQLGSIENAANFDMASTKPHRYSFQHGHHRRGRDFSSMTKRAALGILKKRMKGSVVELEPDLFAIAKSGFKLKMARNVSQSFRFVLYKNGKYRNSKLEVDFTPTIVPAGGIECCIKPATKSLEKSGVDDKGQYTFYDVRFKSKERTGKFRCFLKILRNGKVCGNPLCISVRVKQFHSTSDPIDSAEEALPSYSNPRGNFEPTSSANVDVDEGISVFQEYPSSVSSDSEDGEATNRENDNDEGIDTKLDASCSAFEKLSVNDSKFSPFDEDSDSSVSLLLDENEVREVIDEEFDSVKIPPCFIPNADMNTIPVSVRVKRKINFARKKKPDTLAAPPPKSPTKKNDYWWKLVSGDQSKNTEIYPATDNFENLARPRACKPISSQKHLSPPDWFYKARSDFYAPPESSSSPKAWSRRNFRSFFPSEPPQPVSSQNPTSSYLSKAKRNVDATLEASSSLKQVPPQDSSRSHFTKVKKDLGDSSSKTTDTATKGTYKPLYPTLDDIQESYMKTYMAPNTKSTASKETQSPVAILPEKVFDVVKSVMNSLKQQPNEVKELQKSMDETLRSLSRSVFGGLSPPSGQPCAAPSEPPSAPVKPPVVPTSAAPAANPPATPPPQPEQPACTAAPPTPKSASATAAPVPSTDVPVFAFPDPRLPFSVLGPSQNAYSFDVASQAATVDTNTSNVASATSAPSAETQTSFSTSVMEPVTTNTITSTPPKSPKRSGFIASEEYNRLEPDVRQKILQLNEMGFLNDNYNLFLIRKYPQDMDKIVESLVNYNDF